jgi:hypothetical protein
MAQVIINNGDTGLVARNAINGNFTELYGVDLKTEWTETVNLGTSGTLTKPTGSTILLDAWGNGVDALASVLAATGGLPTFETPVTSGGVAITATLDTGGNWTLSGTPTENSCIIYAYSVPITLYDESKSLTVAQVLDSGPEGTAVKSTGEGGGTKFLREDGDGTCSWQAPAGGGDVTAAANLVDNTIVKADGGGKGVQDSGIVVSDADEVSGGKSLVVEKSDDYTMLAIDSGKSFPQTGAAKTFSLPADTSGFSLGWFVTLYAPAGGVVTVAQLATADATILSAGDFLDITAKGSAVLELVDDTGAAFVFRLSGNLS